MVYPGLPRNRLKWSKRRVAFSKYLLDRYTHTHTHAHMIPCRALWGSWTRGLSVSPTFLIYFTLFILFLAVLGLCCCMLAFFSCSKEGLLSSCSEQASH